MDSRNKKYHRLKHELDEQLRLAGRICPDCNIRRSDAEYRIGMQTWLNCVNCHGKHGRKPMKRSQQ